MIAKEGLFKEIAGRLDPITKFTIEIWNTVMKHGKLETGKRILRWKVYDTRFKPGVMDKEFKILGNSMI